MQQRVFVSYSSRDESVARKLAEDLSREGIKVWIDINEILVGHDLADEVFCAIRGAEFFILLLSPYSVESKWVKEELTCAKIREMQEDRIVVLPVMIKSCVVPAVIANKKFVDLSKSWEVGIQYLIDSIRRHPQTKTVSSGPHRPTEIRIAQVAKVVDKELRERVRKVCVEHNVEQLTDHLIELVTVHPPG